MLSEIVWILGTGIVGLILGYFFGKNERERIKEETFFQESTEENGSESDHGKKQPNREERTTGEKRTGPGNPIDDQKWLHTGEWEIASPCGGETEIFREKGKKGILIRSQEECIYAPAAGKVIRIFPMGNAFILRTDKGVELTLRVGSSPDELCSMYYRPRMMCNEVVPKGKLLLTFDREKLRSAGEDDTVYLFPELGAWVQPPGEDGDNPVAGGPTETVMEYTDQNYVKAGETIIRIVERKISSGG